MADVDMKSTDHGHDLATVKTEPVFNPGGTSADGGGELKIEDLEELIGEMVAQRIKTNYKPIYAELDSIAKSESDLHKSTNEAKSILDDYSVVWKYYEKRRLADDALDMETKCVQVDVHGYTEVPRTEEEMEAEEVKPEPVMSVQDQRREELARKIIRNQLKKDLTVKPIKREIKPEPDLMPFIKEEKPPINTNPVYFTPSTSYQCQPVNYTSPNYSNPTYTTPCYLPTCGSGDHKPTGLDGGGDATFNDDELEIIGGLSTEMINQIRGMFVKKEKE